MKKSTFLLSTGLLMAMAVFQAQTPIKNETKINSKGDWKILFDGKTTKGWHNYNKTGVSPLWKVENEVLEMSKSGAGDLVTDDEFENFELQMEWKISEGGNSGIFYMVKEDPKLETPWKSGAEMQVLDDDKHPDAKLGKDGNRKSGSLYDLIPAKNKTPNPVGEWNKVRVIKKKNHVEHWLNDVKVVEYDLGSPAFVDLVKNSKFSKMPDFAKYKKGHIALQDHGDLVWYRNIKIKTL